MSLSTEILKEKLINKYQTIQESSLKRISKKNNHLGQVVRTFSSNIGQISVTSDKEDTEIVDIVLNDQLVESNPVAKPNKFSKYYFAVGDKVELDSFTNMNYVEVAIVPKKYWDQNQFLYDQPLAIESSLSRYNIESPNETSSCQAFNYSSHLDVLKLLESLGMEYKNEISHFLISTGQPMFIKP